MSEVNSEAKRSKLTPLSVRDMVRVAIFGAISGAVALGIYILFEKFVFSAVLCRPQSIESCASAPQHAALVATIIASIVGVVLLSKSRIYRPLFVVIAVAAALWNLHVYLVALPIAWAIIAVAGIGAVAFAVFTWLARIHSFALSLVLSAALVFVVRMLLV